MSITLLQGQEGVIDVDGMYYAKRSYMSGLNALNPDVVFVHTITPHLVQELPQISQRFITVMRVAVNFEEIHSQPGTARLVSDFWRILGLFDAIICPSKFVLRNLQSLGYKNVIHIPTAIDCGRFPRTKGEENNVLSVGRLGVIKNTITSLLAFSRVKSEVPDARMIVIGDGPHRRIYQNLIEKLGLQQWVELRGMQPAHPYYEFAKVFIQSSFSENGSLTVLEALASGVPCVLSDVGGHKYGSEAIRYVEHDDVDKFAWEMIHFLTSENYWKIMSEKAYIDARKYDIGEVKKQYLELFEKLMVLKKFKR